MTDTTALPELVGHKEVAAMLGIGHQSSWRLLVQGSLPEPDYRLVSKRGRPLWLRWRVEAWASEAGRELAEAKRAVWHVEAPEVVGLGEIAELAGVKHPTAWQWRGRNLLPPAEWEGLAGGPVWLRSTAVAWLRETGRLVDAAPAVR